MAVFPSLISHEARRLKTPACEYILAETGRCRLGRYQEMATAKPRECAKECCEKLFRSHEMEIKYGLGDEFPGQPPFADGYENALNDVVLQRILLLVLLLDRAQNHKAHPKAPKLFNVDAYIKSTKDLAQKLLTACLRRRLFFNLEESRFHRASEQTPRASTTSR